MGEEKHKEAKRDVKFTSSVHDPIKQLMMKINTANGLHIVASSAPNSSTYMAGLVRDLMTTQPRLISHCFPTLQPELQDPIKYHASDLTDCDSAIVQLRKVLTQHQVREQGFKYKLRSDPDLRRSISLRYQALGRPVFDVGNSNLQYGESVNFVESGKLRKVRLGEVYRKNGITGLFRVQAIFQHQMNSKTTFIYVEQLLHKMRNESLHMDIYQRAQNTVPELQPLGWLHGAAQAHMVPVSADAISIDIISFVSTKRQIWTSEDLIRAFNVDAFYHNRWWVDFH